MHDAAHAPAPMPFHECVVRIKSPKANTNADRSGASASSETPYRDELEDPLFVQIRALPQPPEPENRPHDRTIYIIMHDVTSWVQEKRAISLERDIALAIATAERHSLGEVHRRLSVLYHPCVFPRRILGEC